MSKRAHKRIRAVEAAVPLLLAVLLVTALVVNSSPEGVADTHTLVDFDPGRLGARVLFVAPHPDDEGLAAAGLIQQALSEHRRVKVVVVTSGDGCPAAARRLFKSETPTPEQYREIGRSRVRDTENALRTLGVPPADTVFLAYPDGGTNSLWGPNWDYDRLHTGLNGAVRAPYDFAFERNAPYCGANLENNLEQLIRDYRPSCVVYPDGEDSHHDHWAVNAFVQYALEKIRCDAAELTYLVHRHDFPYPMAYAAEQHLEPPQKLLGLATAWQVNPLTTRQEAEKQNAVALYEVPHLTRETFFESFIRRNELLGVPSIGKVPQAGGGVPNLNAEPMPFIVQVDPHADGPRQSPDGSGDLLNVSMCKGKTWSYLGAGTAGPYRNLVTYVFRIRIFGRSRDSEVQRLDIYVDDDRARCPRLAGNSIAIDVKVQVTTRDHGVWIRLPSSVFHGKRAIMMSAECMLGPRRCDRTAWQRYSI